MKIVQNDKYIKTRGRIGRYAFFGGFGLLVTGLLISLNVNRADLFPISFACLILGILLSQFGGMYMRRFDRGELPHLTLAKALKGFDDRYTLVNYAAPASHVLLTADAVYVLVPKAQAGRISFKNGRWKNPTGIRRIFTWMSEEGLGNPTREAHAEAARLQRFLARQMPDTPVEVQPIVVFLHPNAELDISDSPVPAVHVKKLKDLLRTRPKGGLSRDMRAALGRLLEPAPAS
ncbi:MAG TPA: nuclease-related domain-containing protein [Anaerolineae bacterium]|nr:nuclease-related domain-containing protein [Anaerolineae bacterium]